MAEDLTRQEIESHSSQLTNMRIANLSRAICLAEMEATNAMPPTVQHVIAYHSALLTFFLETSESYDTNVNKTLREEIQKCVRTGETMSLTLKYNQNIKQLHIELMLNNCKKWRYLMHRGMQNLKYWFRFGKHDPKGIDEMLKLFGVGKSKEVIENEVPGHSTELPNKPKEQPTTDEQFKENIH